MKGLNKLGGSRKEKLHQGFWLGWGEACFQGKPPFPSLKRGRRVGEKEKEEVGVYFGMYKNPSNGDKKADASIQRVEPEGQPLPENIRD